MTHGCWDVLSGLVVTLPSPSTFSLSLSRFIYINCDVITLTFILIYRGLAYEHGPQQTVKNHNIVLHEMQYISYMESMWM